MINKKKYNTDGTILSATLIPVMGFFSSILGVISKSSLVRTNYDFRYILDKHRYILSNIDFHQSIRTAGKQLNYNPRRTIWIVNHYIINKYREINKKLID